MHVAQAFAKPGLAPVTDCGSVVRSAVAGPSYSPHEKRPWAALWIDIGGQPGLPVKVTAHFSREQSAELGQLDLWHGNGAADAAAKARAYLLLPPSAVCDILSSAEAARVKLHPGLRGCSAFALYLPTWLSPPG